MEFVVAIACLYGQGCGEAANSYYLSQPQLQNEVHYFETKVENTAGKRTTAALGTTLLLFSGNNWTYKINSIIVITGGQKWENLKVSYLSSF